MSRDTLPSNPLPVRGAYAYAQITREILREIDEAPRVPGSHERPVRFVTREDLRELAEASRTPNSPERRFPSLKRFVRFLLRQSLTGHDAAIHVSNTEQSATPRHPENRQEQHHENNRNAVVLGASTEHPELRQVGVPPVPMTSTDFGGLTSVDGSTFMEDDTLADEDIFVAGDTSSHQQPSTDLRQMMHRAVNAKKSFELPKFRPMSFNFNTLFEDDSWTELIPNDPSNQPIDVHRQAAEELQGEEVEAISSHPEWSSFLRGQDGFLLPDWHVLVNNRLREKKSRQQIREDM